MRLPLSRRPKVSNWCFPSIWNQFPYFFTGCSPIDEQTQCPTMVQPIISKDPQMGWVGRDLPSWALSSYQQKQGKHTNEAKVGRKRNMAKFTSKRGRYLNFPDSTIKPRATLLLLMKSSHGKNNTWSRRFYIQSPVLNSYFSLPTLKFWPGFIIPTFISNTFSSHSWNRIKTLAKYLLSLHHELREG